MPQDPKTLISYRRDDSSGWARGLYDRLTKAYGEDRVFIDFDGIGSGEDFEEKIISQIKSSDVLLAMLGQNWLNARDEDGTRRLEQEDDPVRVEIRTGLDESMVLIPVTVDGARMPKAKSLPQDISRFARINAHDLGLKTFHPDVDDLISEIELQLKLKREKAESTSAEARISALEAELAAAKAELSKERKAQKARKIERKPFDAYLAYSHKDNSRIAATLQRALEDFPAVDGRRLRIFRDSTDLAASPNLMSNIKDMLDNSEYLILLASPSAAQSHWIDVELSYFLERHDKDRILTVLAAGDPESAFPMQHLEEMPLYVDLRGYQDNPKAHRDKSFKNNVAKIVAAIHNVPLDEVSIGRIRDRKKQQLIVAISFLLLGFIFAGIYMFLKS